MQTIANPHLQLTASTASDAELLKERKARILASLRQGLPTLPGYLFELNRLLSEPNPSLWRVADIIRTDPSLAAQVLRQCNAGLAGGAKPVAKIELAVAQLGRERLAALVMTCALLECRSYGIGDSELTTFWQHSYLAAQISERLAQWTCYPDPDLAYLAGLLHDIGALPLLSDATHENPSALGVRHLEGALPLQNDFFGIDHCELGRRIGASWNFAPEMVEVLEFHHDPEKASIDPALLGIVAAADEICHSRGVALGSGLPQLRETVSGTVRQILRRCRPDLPVETVEQLARNLKQELLGLIQGLVDPPGKMSAERSRSAGPLSRPPAQFPAVN